MRLRHAERMALALLAAWLLGYEWREMRGWLAVASAPPVPAISVSPLPASVTKPLQAWIVQPDGTLVLGSGPSTSSAAAVWSGAPATWAEVLAGGGQ